MKLRAVKLVFIGVLAFILTGCTGLFSHTLREEFSTPREYRPSPTGQYIVVFERWEIPQGLQEKIAALGGTIVREFRQIGVLVAKSTDPEFPGRVASIPGVLEVGDDPVVELPPTEEEPIFSVDPPPVDPVPIEPSACLPLQSLTVTDPWYVLYQWDIKRVGGVEATWLITQGEGVTVAVLDTGVYSNYPGALVHPSYPTGHPDIQPNLLFGKSFVDPSVDFGPGYVILDDGTPQDYYGHGTHVAGSIAGAIDGSRGVGVAPQAKIANYKVLLTYRSPEGRVGGSGLFSWIIAGLLAVGDDAATYNIRVANMSLGGALPMTDPNGLASYLAMARATQYAWEKGVLVVASAGNSASDWSRGPWRRTPGGTPAALAVTATGPYDDLASYSDYGAFNADFAGPGGDDIPGVPYQQSWCLSAWSPVSQVLPATGVWTIGTSMAAPKVSGVAALVFAKNPGLGPTEVVRILERTAEDLGKPGFDFQFGWGLVNAYRALTQ